MENELLRIVVAADKGADILELLYKPMDSSFSGGRMAGFAPLITFDQAVPSLPVTSASTTREVGEMLPNGRPQAATLVPSSVFRRKLPWDYRIEVDQIDHIEVKFTLRTVRLPIRRKDDQH